VLDVALARAALKDALDECSTPHWPALLSRTLLTSARRRTGPRCSQGRSGPVLDVPLPRAAIKDALDQCSTSHWPALLYAVTFLYVTLRRRSSFGAPAWNVPHDWTLADLSSTVRCVQNHADGFDRSPVSQSVSRLHWPTQPSILSGPGNEYQPKVRT